MNDRCSLCRIKVNKMLSSLNLNNNIFIPKYTLNNKKEEKYSYINKSKEKSSKVNHSNIMNNNNSYIKESKNKSTIETTEENYTKQPIDFIINHGVLVYQRNLKGEEIINLGINNEYLRKNNFKIDNNCIKQSFLNNKNIKLNNSKKSLFSMNDTHSSKNKNKNNSFCRNKIFCINNLNSTLNSNSSVNSMNINNIKINCDKNKLNKAHTQLNLNNKKNVINYVRKKKNNNENAFHIIRNKKNYGTSNNDENVMLNNEKCMRDTNNLKKKIKFSPKKQKHNFIINNNFKISKLIHSLHIAKIFYLKKYYKIFISNLSKKVNEIINNLNNKTEETDKNKAIDENIRNTTYNQRHNKSNNILVNKTLSPTSTNTNEYQSNSNKNLSLLISKNLRFFSKDKGNNNKDENIKERRPSELFRDSNSLRKKFEQICRRKRKEKTVIFSNRFRDTNSPLNYLSDTNKTNSFSNLCDNNSVNSFQIKNNYNYNFNQLYRDNSIDNENNKENKNNNNIISNTNVTGEKLIEFKNEKNKNRIKLVKNNEKNNIRFNKYIISNNTRKKTNSYNHFGQNKESMKEKDNIKKNSFSINNKENINNNSISSKNKNIFKKVFIHKRNNYFLEDNNIIKIKEKIMKRNITYNNSNDPYNFKNKNIALLIKNICTKDRRIFVHITYIPLVLTSNNNYKKYNYNLLKVENIFSYKYMNKKKKNKRNNEFGKKLSLIREEDEKSKNLNSTKSSIKLEEDLNSNKNNANNIRITQNIRGNYLNIVKIVNLLEKYFCKYHKGKKKEFIFNLKIIFLLESIKKIIKRNTKNTLFIKYIKEINEQRNNDVYNSEKGQNNLDDKNIDKKILISHKIET